MTLDTKSSNPSFFILNRPIELDHTPLFFLETTQMLIIVRIGVWMTSKMQFFTFHYESCIRVTFQRSLSTLIYYAFISFLSHERSHSFVELKVLLYHFPNEQRVWALCLALTTLDAVSGTLDSVENRPRARRARFACLEYLETISNGYH